MTNPVPTWLGAQLWSPVQNTSLWLAWWLHGIIGADEVIDAFHATQGKHHRLEPHGGGLVELLGQIRGVTDEAPVGLDERPLIQLMLSGPGDAALLPTGAEGASLIIADADALVSHVLSPRLIDAHLVSWSWDSVEGPVPPLPVYSPGEADQLLREAADEATAMVQNTGHVPKGGAAFQRAELAVGALNDAFGLPGMPPGVPSRAAKLMARADQVAAIVEVTKRSEVGASLDPYLMPMLRAVRNARMVAVDYAQRELLR
ncbi:hypothetical protein [uncultured Corynebacterium sp.]|uniref:hypothetical protein n=1 Tax=uncultured Corynebacterium sp. TaxID=159447 RepID=UPI0025CCD977|nr:hypothetical protein [uncultured Corynebacterium sp.]